MTVLFTLFLVLPHRHVRLCKALARAAPSLKQENNRAACSRYSRRRPTCQACCPVTPASLCISVLSIHLVVVSIVCDIVAAQNACTYITTDSHRSSCSSSKLQHTLKEAAPFFVIFVYSFSPSLLCNTFGGSSSFCTQKNSAK